MAEAELAEAETQKTPATSLRRIGTNLTVAENPVWNEYPMQMNSELKLGEWYLSNSFSVETVRLKYVHEQLQMCLCIYEELYLIEE